MQAAAFLVAFFLPFVAYLPAIFGRYGFSDDYPILAGAVGLGGPGLWDDEISQGRPLGRVVYQVSFSVADTIGGLSGVRLWGVLGLSLLCVAGVWLLLCYDVPLPLAVATAGAAAFLPSSAELVAWATTAPFLWVCLISGAAGVLVVRARSLKSYAVAVGLVTVSLLIYQPCAMFLWCVIGVVAAAGRLSPPDHWRLVRNGALVTVTALLSAAVCVLTTATLSGVSLSSRSNLVTTPAELLDKVEWLVTRLIVTGARPFAISSPSSVQAAVLAGPVLAVIVVGLFLRFPGPARARALSLVLVAITVGMSVLPNVVVAENQFDFRIVACLAPLMLVLLVLALETIIEVVLPSRRLAQWITVGVAAALAGWGFTVARSVVNDHFVRPGEAVHEYFRQQLAHVSREPSTVTIYVPSSGWEGPDDLGVLSTRSDLQHGWVAVPLARLVLRELGRSYAQRIAMREVHEIPRARNQSDVLLDTRPFQAQLTAGH